VLPQVSAAGYAGIAEIETSTAAAVHMDTAPLPIVDGGQIAAMVASLGAFSPAR
jgi:hypothetical protein